MSQAAAQFSKAGDVGRDAEETPGVSGAQTNCKLHRASTGLWRAALESGEMRVHTGQLTGILKSKDRQVLS